MSVIGSFALLLALCLSAYSFLAGFLALFGKDATAARLGETARRAGIATFAAVLLAGIVLVMAAFNDDFSIAYIFHHSNRELPAAYKFAVLWSGQEGSLLFWSLLLAGYGFVLRLRYKTDQRLFAYASVIIASVQVFFLLILNFAARPFGIIEGALPADGTGLNPLLQYPEMVIHPPMLYLGYVGFTVPFAFALGALIMKYPGEKWIHITRRWTMVTWCFLTIGVFLGAHWAYAVLGWGGYWGWDPVENASLMPWLTGTAFLHSVIMQEKRGMLKVWNMALIFATFLLSMLGTFLTRSGVISSVHAFAQSSIGTWFLVFSERAFGVCRQLLFELLTGYTGVDIADRGADPAADAVLTVDEMEYLIATWIVSVWQKRQLGEYAPSWDPAGAHSPNSLFAASFAQAGFAMEIPSPELFYELLPAHYVRIDARRGVKIRGLWYDDEKVLRDYRGQCSTRGGKHKGQWVIRRDPRDRRAVFFQDPITYAWHPLAWTGLPAVGQMPAFGDARVRDLLKKAGACGMKPKSDTELLPVLLELIGSKIPVSQWPAQLSKSQRTEHAREAAQARVAETDRPATAPPAGPEAAQEQATVTALQWPQRARQARDSLDAERRRRREAVVPGTPTIPPPLGSSFRERNVFLLSEDDPTGEEEDGDGPAGRG